MRGFTLLVSRQTPARKELFLIQTTIHKIDENETFRYFFRIYIQQYFAYWPVVKMTNMHKLNKGI